MNGILRGCPPSKYNKFELMLTRRAKAYIHTPADELTKNQRGSTCSMSMSISIGFGAIRS